MNVHTYGRMIEVYQFALHGNFEKTIVEWISMKNRSCVLGNLKSYTLNSLKMRKSSLNYENCLNWFAVQICDEHATTDLFIRKVKGKSLIAFT